MPEGHTLHRLAGQFRRVFVGAPWRVSSPQGRFSDGAALLSGHVPAWARAHGKQLFIGCGAHIWQVHLGLYGAFSFRGDENFDAVATLGAPRVDAAQWEVAYDSGGWVVPTPPVGAVRARIQVPHGWADLRGPSRCRVLSEDEYHAILDRLGPDPLATQPLATDPLAPDSLAAGAEADSGLAQFTRNLSRRSISIAAALMDQSVIAGVGNIYRAESLFVEGIDPFLPARELSGDRIGQLWHTITQQMLDGVREGIIRTVRPGQSGLSPERLHWVYKHTGTQCIRCPAMIRQTEIAGRILYWCEAQHLHQR